MAMTQYTGDTDIIAALGTTPQERGLETPDFKAKFDEGLKEFVTWFNDTHKTEFEAVQTDLTTHLADNVTDADGAHGLKIESGAFTPTIAGTTTAGTNTYNHQVGYYKKIGNQVFFDLSVLISAKDAAMAGIVMITGLPFACKNQANGYVSCAIGRFDYVTLGTYTALVARIAPNVSQINFLKSAENAAPVDLDTANIASNCRFIISGSYQI